MSRKEGYDNHTCDFKAGRFDCKRISSYGNIKKGKTRKTKNKNKQANKQNRKKNPTKTT